MKSIPGEAHARTIFAQALTEARAVFGTEAAEGKLLPAGPGFVIAVSFYTVGLIHNDENPDCRDLPENLSGRTIDEVDITS